MNEDKAVYDYIIKSISDTLNSGVEYYLNKNDLLANRLKEILKIVNEPVLVLNETKKIHINKLSAETINSKSSKEIEEMINSFINKIISIKISILNMEYDALYLKKNINNSLDNKHKTEDIEISTLNDCSDKKFANDEVLDYEEETLEFINNEITEKSGKKSIWDFFKI